MKAEYALITPEEKRLLCNGVGPQNLHGLCRLIPQVVFAEAANRHDWDYTVGGGAAEYARANLRFYAGCLFAVADQSPLWKWPGHLCLAHLYYVLVKVGGGLAFNWGTVRTHEEMQRLAVALAVLEVEEALDKEKVP